MWCMTVYPLLNEYSSNPSYRRLGERERKLTTQAFGKHQMTVTIIKAMGVENNKEITKPES